MPGFVGNQGYYYGNWDMLGKGSLSKKQERNLKLIGDISTPLSRKKRPDGQNGWMKAADDGKRFLKRWELVYEVVGGGGFGGGGGGNLVPGGQPNKLLEHFLPPQGCFLVFFPVFSRFFVDAAYHV